MDNVGKCGWCDEAGIGFVTIHPPKYRSVGAKRMIVKPALNVPACRNHIGIVERQPVFYTCGCTHSPGSLNCPVHGNKIRSKIKQAYE